MTLYPKSVNIKMQQIKNELQVNIWYYISCTIKSASSVWELPLSPTQEHPSHYGNPQKVTSKLLHHKQNRSPRNR